VVSIVIVPSVVLDSFCLCPEERSAARNPVGK
jgi:hypothetical protein